MARVKDALEEKLDELDERFKEEFNEEELKLYYSCSKEELVTTARAMSITIKALLDEKFDLERRKEFLEEKLETLKVFLKNPAFEKEAFQKRKTEGRKEGILGTIVFVVLPILAWVKFVVLAE